MTDEKQQEYTRRISQANATELVVILYEIALEHAKAAEEAMAREDKGACTKALNRVRACINELIGSLHYDYEPAGALLQLYVYCSKQLVSVGLHQDAEALQRVTDILGRLHDAYDKIKGENHQGPVMGNAQSVYAGLTYGKGSLKEDVVGLSGNRGYLA